MRRLATVAALALTVAVGAGCNSTSSNDSGGSGDSGSSSARHVDYGNKDDATDVCHTFVKDRLKAPTTAKFSGDSATQVRGSIWLVAGDVDAENSFGAPLRENYSCKVQHVSGTQYKLIQLVGLK